MSSAFLRVAHGQLARGHRKEIWRLHNATMYIMAGLLVVAFFANLAVTPVSDEHIEHAPPGPRPRSATPHPAHG